MSRILEETERLALQPDRMLRGYLAYPCDRTKVCGRLTQTAEEFLQRTTEGRKPRIPLDPKQVWRNWGTHKYDPASLGPQEIKTLCISPDMATTPELVNALLRNPEPLKLTSCLVGLISSYFVKWGDIRHQDRMEELIRDTLASYTRRNPLLLNYREHVTELFDQRSDTTLARQAVNAHEATAAVLSRFHVGPATNLASATAVAAVHEFLARLKSPSDIEEGLRNLDYGLTLLATPGLRLKDFYAAVSSLILREWAERYPLWKDRLRRYVLSHARLGDPRLKSASWAGMEKAASERFLSWIARENIIFFFNHVLPDSSLNRRRKDFWLCYTGLVKDFQVALSEQDYLRLLAASRLADVPGFARVNHPTTSAFIMRFGESLGSDIILVEFSETGNAAHKFDARLFEVKAGKLRLSRFEFGPLKHRADENRILHQGDRWEYTAFQKMAEWGVRL